MNVNNNFQQMHFLYIYYISYYISYDSHRIDSEQAGSRYNNHMAKRLTMTTFYNF
jgi:hypothetical protein